MSGAPISSMWHVDDELLRQWVDGLAGPLASLSVEQHLQRCATCRAAVAGLVPPEPLDLGWNHILADIEVPPLGVGQRMLALLGMRPADALVVGAALSLRAAWLGGVIGVLVFTVLAAALGGSAAVGLFLVVAPLVPVAGVAVAYGPSSDPSYEVVQAAPYAMVRLVLLRTAAVLATSVPVVVTAGLVIPASSTVAVAWLLPAVGFIILTLAASNWVDPGLAAGVVAIGWVVTVGLASRAGDPMVVFAPAALVTYVAIAAAGGLVLLHRLLGAIPSWRLR